jgi:hypothetical protein
MHVQNDEAIFTHTVVKWNGSQKDPVSFLNATTLMMASNDAIATQIRREQLMTNLTFPLMVKDNVGMHDEDSINTIFTGVQKLSKKTRELRKLLVRSFLKTWRQTRNRKTEVAIGFKSLDSN